ncbi:hypothetical protein Pmani_034976 [Petrolisthes manimaculis]|uniref:Uncharacterized protein n=1 Tax=Petrolisthes manimaculis TaxID=1843537 RepID=A0AAE1NLJ1_9EUCA|nr:hypothetical protein Pmani_034976 [Petrolisthes manimaculis]
MHDENYGGGGGGGGGGGVGGDVMNNINTNDGKEWVTIARSANGSANRRVPLPRPLLLLLLLGIIITLTVTCCLPYSTFQPTIIINNNSNSRYSLY